MLPRAALWLIVSFSFIPPVNAQASLPEGEGREIVADVCSQCHGLVYITDSRRTAAQWQYIVSMMVALGAPLQPEEIGPVIQYLVENLGTEAEPDPVTSGDNKNQPKEK